MGASIKQGKTVFFSEEPMIHTIHLHLVEIVFVGYLAALCYLSFVPFDFSMEPAFHSYTTLIWGLPIQGISIPDIFANIGLYMPLGALAGAVLHRRNVRRVVSGFAAVLFSGMLSFTIEHGQHWVVSRVSSWVDVTANVIGALMGAVFMGVGSHYLNRMIESSHSSIRRNGWKAAGKVAVCLLLVLHLRPFDVVADLTHTAAVLRHADGNPLAAWNGLAEKVEQDVAAGRRAGRHEHIRVQWEYALDRVVDVVSYAVLAVMLALGFCVDETRPKSPALPGVYLHNRRRMYAGIGFVIISLAMIVTVIRVFLFSHGLDTAHFVCGIAGGLIGCGVAEGLLRRLSKTTAPRLADNAKPRVRIGVPAGLLHVAIAGGMMICLLYELVPFDFGTAHRSAANVIRASGMIPFAAHFHSRPNDAFYDISGKFLIYGAIGIGLSLLFLRKRGMEMPVRRHWRRQLIATMLITMGCCLVFQVAHLTMATRHSDVTTVLISIVAAFTGSVAVRWVLDYRASLSVTHVCDPLTHNLIEGDSYDKTRDNIPIANLNKHITKDSGKNKVNG